MGITGLIPFLEKASSKINIKDLRGCTVVIDTYCWLHKGAFACADKLSRGEDTDIHIQFCIKYVNLLLSHDIKPILVFDGRHLPAKALTEQRRRESRENSKKRAAELLRLGRVDEARSHLRRCVDITHEMALRLIQECRKRNVDCIVAPYEADAQMAYLNKIGIAHYVITEDSDLVLFGCNKIIFKLDLNGHGLLAEADKLHLAMGCRAEKYTLEKFRIMCILSGCDYLDSLPGIGLAKACKFVLKTEETDIRKMLLKIPQYLNMRNLNVTDEYINNFCVAEATFKHMFVYDPLKRQMVRLNDPSELGTDLKLCCNAGTPLDDDTATQLAFGNIDPFTFKRLDDWDPDKIKLTERLRKSFNSHSIAKHRSIWQRDYKNSAVQNKISENRCAFHFKKVDFSTSEEIIAESKISEADIISLYSENDLPPSKRYCLGKKITHNLEAQNHVCSKIKSPLKIIHNPFVKTNLEEKSSKAICENKSLLEIVSPGGQRKNGILEKAETNGLKKNQEIVIKSRFFLSNIASVKMTEKQKSYSEVSEDKAKGDEINASLDTVSNIRASIKKIENESSILYEDIEDKMNENNVDKFEEIVISDEEVIGSSKRILQEKSKVRQMGLSKSKIKMSSTQSRLSMFGFKKRASLK